MPKLYSSPQAGLNWSILAKSQSCVRGAGNPDNVSDEHPNTVPDSMLVVRKLIAVTRHRPWSGGDQPGCRQFESRSKMGQLKETGLGFTLDVVGAGYPSSAYLTRLPLDHSGHATQPVSVGGD
jgi:hypothetical protein